MGRGGGGLLENPSPLSNSGTTPHPCTLSGGRGDRLLTISRLRVILFHHIKIGGLCVFFDLSDVFASRDDHRDGRMLKAPRQRPARHRHTLGNLFASEALDFLQAAPAPSGLGVSLGTSFDEKCVPGFSPRRSEIRWPAACNARTPRFWRIEGKHSVFRRAIEPIVNDLNRLNLRTGRPVRLMNIVRRTDRVADVQHLALLA